MSAPTNPKDTVFDVKDKNTSKKVLRVGIVGAGLMGGWHAVAAKRSGGKIAAIADINQFHLRNLHAKYPQAQIFSDAARMIEQSPLDVLHICSPLASHYEIAGIAAEKKINVLIEKPLAPTADETLSLYDSAAKNNVRLCPVHQFVFQRSVAKAKKLLPQIGQILHLQATICSAGGDGRTQNNLGEISNEMLPHPLSLIQPFFKEPLIEKNFNVFSTDIGELRITGHAEEISLSILISLKARPTLNSFQLFGTSGTIYLDLFHDFAFIESGKVSRMRKVRHPFDFSVKMFFTAFHNLIGRSFRFETAYPGLQNLIGCFYQSVRENSEPPITSTQAINIARVRDFIINQRP
ncbi:MAG: Gfo/Idh/MocA family protein [Pyrinomonadaceae bacterium]